MLKPWSCANAAALFVFVFAQGAHAQSAFDGQFSLLKPAVSQQVSLLNSQELVPDIGLLPAPADYQAAAYPVSAAAPYLPHEIVYDNNGRFYTGRNEGYLVTYDAETAEQLHEIWLDGEQIYSLAWSETHQRLYVGLSNGEIRYVDPSVPDATQAFATLSQTVIGLGDAGNYLLAVAQLRLIQGRPGVHLAD